MATPWLRYALYTVAVIGGVIAIIAIITLSIVLPLTLRKAPDPPTTTTTTCSPGKNSHPIFASLILICELFFYFFP